MTLFPLPCLMLVTEPTPDLPHIVAEAVAGGVNCVQWRDKATGQIALQAQAGVIGDFCRGRALLLINGPLTLAETVGEGLHLPEAGFGIAAVRPALRAGALIGKSVHSVRAAQQAEADGADYVLAGTIYPSQSHPNTPAQGIDFLREVCHSVSIPVLAVGGVTADRIAECVSAGAAGVAVLSAMMRSDNPRQAAQQYRAALDAAKANIL